MFLSLLVSIFYNLKSGYIFAYKLIAEKCYNIKINSLSEGWELKLDSKKSTLSTQKKEKPRKSPNPYLANNV